MDKTKYRNTNIELLRLLMMLSIFIWHIIVHGLNFKMIGTDDFIYTGDLNIISIILSAFSPCVYCFMFISGFYGIKFSFVKYIHFVYMAIFTLFISYFIKYYCFNSNPSIDITYLFPIINKKWWFLTCYVEVFFLSPLIDLGFRKILKKYINIIIAILTIIMLASFFKFKINSGSNLFGLLYIYILGRYFKQFNVNISLKRSIILYLFSFITLSIIEMMSCNLSINLSKLSFAFLSYNNPLIIVMSIVVFFIFKNLSPIYNDKINKVIKPVFVIYLLTEAIGMNLYELLAKIFFQNIFLFILYFLSTIFFCLVVGYIEDYLFTAYIYKGIKILKLKLQMIIAHIYK